MTLRLGTTHNYNYFVDGRSVGTYDVAGYNPDSYPLPGVEQGKLSEKKTLASKIYPGMTANYWVYVNTGADVVRGAPLMVWQDGETIVGNQDLLRLRLQIVSDNLVHKKLIPPMVHVLISPGSGGEAQGTRMRSIQYDTVSDRYGKYLLEEVPLGGSQQDVIDMLRRNRWLDFEVNELVGFDDQRTSTSGLVGAKHIRANLGDYRGIIFSTNVTVFWGFNQRGELIDVWVWKTTDSF